jgi:hypothetical protein
MSMRRYKPGQIVTVLDGGADRYCFGIPMTIGRSHLAAPCSIRVQHGHL